MPLLDCIGLVKQYPRKRAVDGVNFHGGQEAAFGLIGGLRGVVGFTELFGALFDAFLERGIEFLQLREAFGVFKRGAGDGDDEVGQALLLRAEQGAHTLVNDVQECDRFAADEEWSTQSGVIAGDFIAVAALLLCALID